MNKQKFDVLLTQLAFQQAVPTRIEFDVPPTFEPHIPQQAYTRVNWGTGDITSVEMDVDPGTGPQRVHFVRFAITTRTRLVRVGAQGIPPNSQEPEESDVIMDAKLNFMIEYALQNCEPVDLDQEAIAEFFAKNVPFNMWPYFRELVHNLAIRSRLPLPTIPPFRVPATHQAAK